MAHDTFLLAHVSDVHLAPVAWPALADLTLKRALGGANWLRHRRHVHVRSVLDAVVEDMRRQRPDHIAVTGDLVNLGLPREHAGAAAWLAALGMPAQVTAVPGNHDEYRPAGGTPGYERWRAFMTADDGAGEGRSSERTDFPFLRRRGPVALIGLGSGVPTAPFVSAGRLGASQLDGLARLLEMARGEGRFSVVALHHPPHRYPREHRSGLEDAGALEALLKAKGAGMVLHGHFHRAQEQWIEGTAGRVPVLGVPSASAAVSFKGADLAGYALYAISAIAPGRHRVEMIRRGLAEPGGGIVETQRKLLVE